jgi:hypothetical protein
MRLKVNQQVLEALLNSDDSQLNQMGLEALVKLQDLLGLEDVSICPEVFYEQCSISGVYTDCVMISINESNNRKAA